MCEVSAVSVVSVVSSHTRTRSAHALASAHALWLHPSPDVLILADRHNQYQLPYEETLAFNPGSFAADFAWMVYRPAAKMEAERWIRGYFDALPVVVKHKSYATHHGLSEELHLQSELTKEPKKLLLCSQDQLASLDLLFSL